MMAEQPAQATNLPEGQEASDSTAMEVEKKEEETVVYSKSDKSEKVHEEEQMESDTQVVGTAAESVPPEDKVTSEEVTLKQQEQMETEGSCELETVTAAEKDNKVEDEDTMDANVGEEFEEDEGTKEQLSTQQRKIKCQPRNPQYPSIIRTRRTSGINTINKQKEDTAKASGTDEVSEEEEGSGEQKERRSSRGRGRGGGLKRQKSYDKEGFEDGTRRGRGRGKISLVTRAAAAGMKSVQFHQLPRRPKRQKTQDGVECEEEELEEPAPKKSKMERESSREEEEEESKDDKGLTPPTTNESIRGSIKASPRGRGRGRGRRGRNWRPEEGTEKLGNKGAVEQEVHDKIGMACKKEDDKQNVVVKKKRGRPKKKVREATNVTPTTTTPISTPQSCDGKTSKEESVSEQDSSTQTVTEPVKGTQQIVQLLELSENMGGEGETRALDKDGVNSCKQDAPDSLPIVKEPVPPRPPPSASPADGVGEEDSRLKKSESVVSEDSGHVSTESLDSTRPAGDPKSSAAEAAAETDNVSSTDMLASLDNTTDIVADSSAEKKEGTPPSDSKPTVTSTPKDDEGEGMAKEEKEKGDEKKAEHDKEATELDTPKTPPTLSSVEALPTTNESSSLQSQPPTTVPVEPTYPFSHRFSPLDEQGYHPFPHMPHPFLAPGYPPFSSPPYPTFMLPTSPHFPQPYPPECLPPEMYPRFPEDFHRYPVHPPPPHPVVGVTSAASTNSLETSMVESSTSNVATPTSAPSPTPVSTHGMPIPHPLSQGYPTYTLPSPYGPPPIVGTGMPPPPMIGEWSMGPPQAPPTPAVQSLPVAPNPKTTKEARFPLSLMSTDDTTNVSQPVDCPECGRHFKNNKALNGHMRLHGGFDWTRRPYQVMHSKQQQQQHNKDSEKKTGSSSDSHRTTSQNKGEDQEDVPKRSKGGRNGMKNGFKGSNQSNHSPPEGRHSATLDDLCRAAEELERIERNGLKTKPSPLILPHEKRIQSFSPPYTPPPILSPARSLMLLSNSAERISGPGGIVGNTVAGSSSTGNLATPNKIWPQRKVSDQRTSDQDELFEPKINIGSEFQADLPECQDNASNTFEKINEHKASLVWKPLEGLSQEDEDTIDGFLELACSPAVPQGGRNKELAMHIFHQVKGSVKEAVRLMVMGKSLVTPDDPMTNYNYTGSKKWSSKERQQFRRAWRVHRKQFQQIENYVETKNLPELVEYYYSWKKYCPDEYRGRNRHPSEEVLSEEDGDIYIHPPSVTSNSSGSNDADNARSSIDPDNSLRGAGSFSVPTEGKTSPAPKYKTTPTKGSSSVPHDIMEHLPRGFMSGQSLGSSFGGQVQEYRCKYPGCNQVYTSIFALNGHIRVHGGSWYPKKPDIESMQSGSKDFSPPPSHSASQLSLAHSSMPLSKLKKEKEEEEKLRHQLEIAKTMVMDLPTPRSPSQAMTSHTPSPRPSPSHPKSSLMKSKKVSSASPADREGHYPCNRCGRVFLKVKSRSAHMKSHIIKPVRH